jgi:hypothetical protein
MTSALKETSQGRRSLGLLGDDGGFPVAVTTER